MIYLSQIVGADLSLHVLTRAKHCAAVKDGRRVGVYRVVPMTRGFEAHRGKSKRRVQFGLTSTSNIYVLCSDYYTNAACEANEREQVCCHAVRAYWAFLKNAIQTQKETRNVWTA